MFRISLIFVVFSLLLPTIVFSQSIIQNVINEVSRDSLISFVDILTGEVEVNLSEGPCFIYSRNKYQPGNHYAAEYIAMKLEGYGLEMVYNQISVSCLNVLGIQLGTLYPEKKYILCAHYDNLPGGLVAPGAGDNASGTAAVIEAARVFSKYSFPYTIIFALWDEEEAGLVGSDNYASTAADQGEEILGVFNLDMISYDSDNDNKCIISVQDFAKSLQLADATYNINLSYNIGLDIFIMNPGNPWSDQKPFWDNGFSAIWISHDGLNDLDTNYHSVDDHIKYYNTAYFERLAKLSFAALAAHASENLVGISNNILNKPVTYSLEQNYPNPFNPFTKINFSIAEKDFVSLKLLDILGNEIITLIDKEMSPGNYSLDVNGQVLSSGIYIYVLKTHKFISTKKMTLIR